MTILINILLLLVVISILTFVHELGHFIAAKLVKAKVLEFAIGFGPKLFSKEYKGTLFSIRALPFGGYVKILGDGDPTPTKESKKQKGNLSNKSKFAQMFVMIAGVTMNLVLSIVIYTIFLANNQWKIEVNPSYESFKPFGAVISKSRISDIPYQLADEGGALDSGMYEQGYIVSIEGEEIESYLDLTNILEKYKSQEIDVYACNEQKECNTFNVLINSEGRLGVYTGSNYSIYLDYSNSKIFSGFHHSVNIIKLTAQTLSSLLSQAKQSGDYSELSNTVSGPIGIYFIIDYFRSLGIVALLGILADISLSLAIINLFPIPALDGGRIFILLIESIIGRDLNEKVKAIIINGSFVLLLLLVLLVMVKDIINIEELKNLFK